MHLQLPFDPSLFNGTHLSPTFADTIENAKYRLLSKIFSYIIPINCSISSSVTVLLIVISIKKGVVGSSTKLFITTIFTLDLLVILILFLLGLEIQFIFQNKLFMDITTYITEIGDLILLSSNWITTLLALERCLAVRNPFLAKRITNSHRVVSIIVVLLSAITLKIVGFILLSLNESYFSEMDISSNATNKSTSDVTNKSISALRSIQSWFVDFALFLVIPFSILCWVSIILLKAIRESKSCLRSQLSNEVKQIKQRNEYKVTIFLCVVLLHFIIFQGPLACYTAIFAIYPFNSGNMIKYQYILRPTFIFIFTIKSEANLAFYLYHNYQFRSRLYQIVKYRPSTSMDCSEYYNIHSRIRNSSLKTGSIHLRLSTSSNLPL